jgi:hypothetical protein
MRQGHGGAASAAARRMNLKGKRHLDDCND